MFSRSSFALLWCAVLVAIGASGSVRTEHANVTASAASSTTLGGGPIHAVVFETPDVPVGGTARLLVHRSPSATGTIQLVSDPPGALALQSSARNAGPIDAYNFKVSSGLKAGQAIMITATATGENEVVAMMRVAPPIAASEPRLQSLKVAPDGRNTYRITATLDRAVPAGSSVSVRLFAEPANSAAFRKWPGVIKIGGGSTSGSANFVTSSRARGSIRITGSIRGSYSQTTSFSP